MFLLLSYELILRIKTIINKTISDVQLCHNDVKKVLLAGGGSRMPMIERVLKNMFPNAEVVSHQHPDEIIAMGAAEYAYDLLSKDATEL